MMSLWANLNKGPKGRTRRQDIVDIGSDFERAAAREEAFHMTGVSFCVAGHFDSGNRLGETLDIMYIFTLDFHGWTGRSRRESVWL
jgi:hypothetical protein